MPPKHCCCCKDCDTGPQFRNIHGKCCGCCGPVGSRQPITLNAYGECDCCCNGQIEDSDSEGNCQPCGECPPCTEQTRCANGDCPTRNPSTDECDVCPCANAVCWDGSFPAPPACQCPPVPCPQCAHGTSPNTLYLTIPSPKCGSRGFDGFAEVDFDCGGDYNYNGLNCPKVRHPTTNELYSSCPPGDCGSGGGPTFGEGLCVGCKSCGDLGGTYALHTGGAWCHSVDYHGCGAYGSFSAVEEFVVGDSQKWQEWKDSRCYATSDCGCVMSSETCINWSYAAVQVATNVNYFGDTGCGHRCYLCRDCSQCDADRPANELCNAVQSSGRCVQDPVLCGNLVNGSNLWHATPTGGIYIRAGIVHGTFGGEVGWGYVVGGPVGSWKSKRPISSVVDVDGVVRPACGESSVLELVEGFCPDNWAPGCCYGPDATAIITSFAPGS